MKLNIKVITGIMWTLPNPFGIWAAFQLQDQHWINAGILIFIIGVIEYCNVQLLIKSQTHDIKENGVK